MTHVYRNRPDDDRTLDELHYCKACDGYYGVPHVGSHCRTGGTPWRYDQCACRPCRERTGKPVEGDYGYHLIAATPPPRVAGTAPGSPVSHGGVEPWARNERGDQ